MKHLVNGQLPRDAIALETEEGQKAQERGQACNGHGSGVPLAWWEGR